MSMCVCKDCAAYVDSDDDPDCFVEVGNMRRMNWTEIVCEPCREKRMDEADYQESAASLAEYEAAKSTGALPHALPLT